MARALLRNAKILILDEASSSTDSATDRIIQKMIRKQFKGCTILCVAHRLETIIDYDYVVVMSSGAVVEYDTPKNLLDKADGQFTKMVNATGRASSANLKKIANMTAREREKAFHTVTESSSEGGFKEFPETDESDVFADDDDSGSENL
jgi:ATP-binding cassette subfamily C (CFTR/MRP) protein 4